MTKKQPNILLVYPKYPDTFWSFKHVLKFISKKAAFPPLGLLTIAAMLPTTWQKKLVDVNVTELTDETIAWADMIFISAMIVQKDSAQNIIKRCKEQNKTVVAGGPVFTTQHNNFTGIDHLILNEAEITLPQFLKDYKKGKTKPLYTSTKRPDVTKTPTPLWNLINFNNYSTMTIQYSRGCPFNCEFCDIVIMNGRIPRAKTPEQMIKEFQTLYDAGWKGSIFIVDDNFIGNITNVKKMLPNLITWQKKHNYPYTLLTEASTNIAKDKELMQLMSLANFNKVFLGIETPSKESLKECGKMQNLSNDLAQSVKIIHQHGMQVMGGFIVGFDNDTENIFDTQIQFIQEMGVVTAMVGLLTALPQTRLWHRLKAEKRLVKDSTGENTDGILNFIPKMNKDRLVKGYHKILTTIYARKQYYQRINTFIKAYKPTVKTKIRKQDLQALLRSIWKIGILSQARLNYWKLILKTSLTKFRALPIAIELAIYGIHFEKTVQRTITT